MNESQLISELRAALDDEAATVRAPAGAAERARMRGRRRRLGRLLAVSVPAAGLAASLVIAVGGSPAPARPPAPQAHSTAGAHQPSVLTAAYVTGRARAALSKVSSWIVESSGPGWVAWSDPVTAASRYEKLGPGGRGASDDMVTYNGRTEHRVYVDYSSRTWWTLTSKVPALPKKPDTSGILPVPGDSASGQVIILGHRALDGRDTIVVRYGPPRGFKPTAYAQWPTELVWLDARTYLPVHIKVSGAGPVEEQSLAYLPVTPPSLAMLTVTPPAGFRQVPPPPFHGDGQPGLGRLP